MVLLLYRWQFHQNQGSKRGFLATAAFASGFALAASAMTCGSETHGGFKCWKQTENMPVFSLD